MALTKIRGNTRIVDQTVTNSQIAFPDINNPDGILLAKIEDGALLVKSDGSVPFTAPVAGVAPVGGSDLTTKDYVDSIATGLDIKQSVRALATTDITLSGTQVIDGVSLIAGDRVLLTGQADASENGIYVVAAGAWARSADADNSPAGEVTSGMFTFVEEGTTYGATGWVLATANPIVLGTTDLMFTQFSEAGQVGAGDGLVANGASIDVVSANGGIVVNPNNIALTVDPNGTLAITGAGIKLADLPSGQVLIGNGSNVATAQTLSGDITISNTGVVTISADAITGNEIAAGAVALTKLESGTSGQIIVVGAGGVPAYQTASGDVTIAATGAVTIANNAVTTAKIADANVTLAKLVSLDPAKIIIGTTGGTNAQVAVSGDATISEAGVLTVDSAVVVKVADIITRETPAGTIDGTNPTFTLAFTPKTGTEHVYYNGILQDSGAGNDYTISGDTITFTFNPVSGDKVRVSYFK